MKKILFVSTRNPYSGRYSGDVIRSLKILNLLKKKYQVDLVFPGNEKSKKIKDVNIRSFKPASFWLKFFYCIVSFFQLNPIQFGLFFSAKMRKYINENSFNYDIIFFHHLRSIQFLPKNYHGKKILDMGDLYSDNYFQTYKYLNFLNPIKYIYLIEAFLIKLAEDRVFSIFDKVLLFSKKEVEKIKTKFDKNAIVQIDESIERLNKKFSFSKNNFKVLFIGNLNYLPNILACKDFVKNVLPNLKNKIPNLKFCIVGDVKRSDKIYLSKNKDVQIVGSKKNLTKYANNSICGLANLSIATGVQVKVLTYMTFGLPVVCSKQVSLNFAKNVLTYNSNSELEDQILKLKNKKVLWNIFSKKSFKFVKKFKWENISKRYLNILNS